MAASCRGGSTIEAPPNQRMPATSSAKKSTLELETEWQKQVKNKKSDEYYKNLKEVFNSFQI